MPRRETEGGSVEVGVDGMTDDQLRALYERTLVDVHRYASKLCGGDRARTEELVQALSRVRGVRVAFAVARFHEAVVTLDRPAAAVLAAPRTRIRLRCAVSAAA